MSDPKRDSGPILDFSALDGEPEAELEWHSVATAAIMRDRRPIVTRIGVVKVVVVKVDGELYALNNSCPHAGGSLGHGPVQGRALVCPVHQWRFDVESGQCDLHPIYVAKRYPVEVRHGEVFVGVASE